MRGLDVRVLAAFNREAQRVRLEESLNLLTVVRAALAETRDYKAVVAELKNQILSVQAGQTETVRRNWTDLKKRGG